MDVLVFDDPGAYDDPASFAARVRPVLLKSVLSTNVLATFLQRAMTALQPPRTCWILIEDDGVAVGAAMSNPGFNLVLSPLPDECRASAASALADVLYALDEAMPGVNGRAVDAQAFAQAWLALGGGPGRVAMNDWLYEIRQTPEMPAVKGFGRSSGPADVPLLLQYLREFTLEAFPGRTEPGVSDEAVGRLKRGGLFVWESGGKVVSFAGTSGPALGVGRIGPVYTPPRFRQKGYGAAVTAFATQFVFEQGAKACMLFADQANATSNGVYSRLGYRIVDSNVMLSFEPPR